MRINLIFSLFDVWFVFTTDWVDHGKERSLWTASFNLSTITILRFLSSSLFTYDPTTFIHVWGLRESCNNINDFLKNMIVNLDLLMDIPKEIERNLKTRAQNKNNNYYFNTSSPRLSSFKFRLFKNKFN